MLVHNVFMILTPQSERERRRACLSAPAVLVSQALVQFELKGRKLHGLQADNRVVGERRLRVHQRQ